MLLTIPLLAATLAGCMEESSDTDIQKETSAVVGDKNAKIDTKPEPLKSIQSTHNITLNGQSFDLLADYGLSVKRSKDWYFTQPSTINLSLKSVNLPANLSLHVNEVYSEVSLVSPYARYNGIRQDSTDLKYSEIENNGMTIDNANDFSFPFKVEGINANETSFYMINGYGGSSTSRITEDRLRANVQGGAVKTVWTVLVTNNDTKQTYTKTISDSIGLPYRYNIE